MMKHVADCFPLITLQNFEHQPLPTESTLEIRVSASGSFKLYVYLQFHVLIAQSVYEDLFMPFQSGRQFCLRPSVRCGILFPIF